MDDLTLAVILPPLLVGAVALAGLATLAALAHAMRRPRRLVVRVELDEGEVAKVGICE